MMKKEKKRKESRGNISPSDYSPKKERCNDVWEIRKEGTSETPLHMWYSGNKPHSKWPYITKEKPHENKLNEYC